MGSNLNKWNLEKMQDYCNKNDNGYIVLEEKRVDKGYQNQQWALVQCPNGHEPTWIWWNHFTHGRRCKYCSSDRIAKSLKKNIDEVVKIFETYGLILDNPYEYKNVDTNITCHDNLGYKYFTNVTCLKMHNSTAKFSKLNPYSLDNIKLFCKLERPEYEIISDKYDGIKEIYTWKYNGDFPNHKETDRLFKCTADGFINGKVKHPSITRSSLELHVSKVLDELHINYEIWKTFDDCKDKGKLLFDFYFTVNKKEYCIETDGAQHFMPVKFWGGQNNFEGIQRRDKIKDNYCLSNGIILIRIPFNKIEDSKNIIIHYLKSTTSSEVSA